MREKSFPTNGRGSARSLRLISGGSRTPSPAGTEHTGPYRGTDEIRDALVARARTRVARGYYQRPDVVERLVDLLWDELYLP